MFCDGRRRSRDDGSGAAGDDGMMGKKHEAFYYVLHAWTTATPLAAVDGKPSDLYASVSARHLPRV